MAGNSLDTYVMDLRARTAKLESDLDKANKKIRAKMRRSGSMMAKDFTANDRRQARSHHDRLAGNALCGFADERRTDNDGHGAPAFHAKTRRSRPRNR